ARSCPSSTDDVRPEEHLTWHGETEGRRRLEVDGEHDAVGALDGQISRTRAPEDLRDQPRSLPALRTVVRAVGNESSVVYPQLGGKHGRNTAGQGHLEQHTREIHRGDVRHHQRVAGAQTLENLVELARRGD